LIFYRLTLCPYFKISDIHVFISESIDYFDDIFIEHATLLHGISANDKGQRARGRLAWIGETSWMAIGKLGSGASRTERRPKSLEPDSSPHFAANS
jgi:hypothetical protein